MKSPTFISYAREDSEFAFRLVGDLKARGVEVWVDRHRLQPGKLWDREVQQALTLCRELVVILSPDAVESEEVMSEVFFVLKRGKVVIPLVHRECSIPYRLERLHYIDFQSGYEAKFQELLGALQVEEIPAARGPKAGDVRVNAKDGLTYVYIPAGTFRMGCSEGDGECYDNETPARDVRLTKGFWLGQTEVTVDAYRRYTRATGQEMPPEPKFKERALNPGWRDGKMPIVNVTWEEAKSYCEWTGGRLPTEAEWEYGARGGTAGARYGTLAEVAWYGDNSGKKRIDTAKIWSSEQSKYLDRLYENENTFHGVGLKAPNGFGLYDMLGNVWEWVADWYDEKYDASGDAVDPQGPPNGRYRTLRGGSWNIDPRGARVSVRNWLEPANRNNSIGFRCVGE